MVNHRWVSDPKEWFTMADFKALIGHADWTHFSGNALGLLFFGIPAELLLGHKRFMTWMTGLVSTYFVLHEVCAMLWMDNGSTGASGWLYATPGLAMYAIVRKVWDADIEREALGIPAVIWTLTMAATIGYDVVNIGAGDGIGHEAHTIGAVIGLAITMASAPIVFKMVKEEINNRRRVKVIRQRYA
jgi:membrane associated rhomboid family serine protease